MTDLFYPDSWLWNILGAAGGGLLGWSVVTWWFDTFRPPFRAVRINTVWDETGKVIYDHPLRGQAARRMNQLTFDFIPPDRFLSDAVFPKK